MLAQLKDMTSLATLNERIDHAGSAEWHDLFGHIEWEDWPRWLSWMTWWTKLLSWSLNRFDHPGSAEAMTGLTTLARLKPWYDWPRWLGWSHNRIDHAGLSEAMTGLTTLARLKPWQVWPRWLSWSHDRFDHAGSAEAMTGLTTLARLKPWQDWPRWLSWSHDRTDHAGWAEAMTGLTMLAGLKPWRDWPCWLGWSHDRIDHDGWAEAMTGLTTLAGLKPWQDWPYWLAGLAAGSQSCTSLLHTWAPFSFICSSLAMREPNWMARFGRAAVVGKPSLRAAKRSNSFSPTPRGSRRSACNIHKQCLLSAFLTSSVSEHVIGLEVCGDYEVCGGCEVCGEYVQSYMIKNASHNGGLGKNRYKIPEYKIKLVHTHTE